MTLVNGGPISSADTHTVTINPVSALDTGAYDCVVSYACSTVTSATAMLSVCDYAGDTNCDAIVDLGDLATLLSNFGMLSGVMRADGDANGDGTVNLQDLAILLSLFGSGCP